MLFSIIGDLSPICNNDKKINVTIFLKWETGWEPIRYIDLNKSTYVNNKTKLFYMSIKNENNIDIHDRLKMV